MLVAASCRYVNPGILFFAYIALPRKSVKGNWEKVTGERVICAHEITVTHNYCGGHLLAILVISVVLAPACEWLGLLIGSLESVARDPPRL